MASGLFGIGASGLAAAYMGLQTTGHNITNVSTPGFKRQQAVQVAATPQAVAAGFIGHGVNVQAITRAYSELATRETVRAETRASEATTQSAYLNRLDSLMGDSDTGIGQAIDSFFNSIQAMSAQPSSSGQRAAFLAQVSNLAKRFSETSGSIEVLRAGAAREMSGSLTSINDLSKQVASLNSRISLASSTGQAANDLLDQRDELVRRIATQVNVTTVAQSDGTVNVFAGTGQPLVVGSRSNALGSVIDPNDPSAIALTLKTSNGEVMMGSDGNMLGGKVGALMNLHNHDLGATSAELGRLATTIATQMNLQHQRGIDLDGNAGGDLFRLLPAPATGSASNTGNASISLSIADSTRLKAADYRLDYDGTNYQVTRLSDGAAQSFATLPAVVDGVGVNIASGTMSAGDSFNLKPVSTRAAGIVAAINDPRKVALALPVGAKASAGNAGTATIQSLSVDPLSNPNLAQAVTLTFTSANTFDVSGTGTGNPTGQAYTAGAPIQFNGWTLALGGAPRAGDTIVIGPNPNPQGDNRNALQLAALASTKIADGMTAAEGYAATIASVGSQANAANLDAKIQGSIKDDAITSEQSFSGVNLDEEAARMMEYQQAYQASAKVISAAQTVFEALLGLGR